MAPNSPACSFIHASMAGSRSTAPLNRSNSVLIADPLSAFELCGYVAPLSFLQQNPSSGTVLLVLGVSLPANATVFYNPGRSVTGLSANWAFGTCGPRAGPTSRLRVIQE